MGYKCTFMDNEVYSAQDVNDALSHIISGGVSNFAYTGNATADINASIAQILQGGVEARGDACKMVKTNGIYKISQGTCFMNDGSQITFDSNGYELSLMPDARQYIYLKRNLLGNTIDIEVSDEGWDPDCIPIAEVDGEGNVYDKRVYAKANIPLNAEPKNIGATGRVQKVLWRNESYSHDIGFDGWKYIIYFLRNEDLKVKPFEDGETIHLPVNNRGGGERSCLITTRNGSVLTWENVASSYETIDFFFEVR